MKISEDSKESKVEIQLVSILINNYNYGHFLKQAIDSALSQTYPALEIIVVDDGSTDESQKIIESYGDKIIPILKQNGGQASAFNQGFLASRGEIICFLDADDFFVPLKVDSVASIFSQHQEAEWLFHPLKLVDKKCQEIQVETYPSASGVYNITLHMKRGKLRGKLPLQGIATSGTCFRRSLLKKVLPMPEEIKITSDDYIKYAALGLSQGFILFEELAFQRIHGNNAYTNRTDKKQLRAEIAILTAYWLKRNFPFLAAFTHKIFAFGAATYSKDESHQVCCQKIINEYQSSLDWNNLLKIKCRAGFYSLKNYVQGK